MKVIDKEWNIPPRLHEREEGQAYKPGINYTVTEDWVLVVFMDTTAMAKCYFRLRHLSPDQRDKALLLAKSLYQTLEVDQYVAFINTAKEDE